MERAWRVPHSVPLSGRIPGVRLDVGGHSARSNGQAERGWLELLISRFRVRVPGRSPLILSTK
jgi:hypothetical protein